MSQQTNATSKYRVLVVDDEEANRLLLREVLEGEGYEVVESTNGAEAQAAMLVMRPDTVLLDVMMPGIDGFEVCERLKANQETTHIPVLLVTALRERADRLRGIRVGATDFLTKPIDVQEVLLRVRNAIKTKSLYDENLAHRELLEIRVAEQSEQLRAAYDQLQRRVRELEVRDQLARLPLEGITPGDAGREILRLFGMVIGCQRVALLRPDAQAQGLAVLAALSHGSPDEAVDDAAPAHRELAVLAFESMEVREEGEAVALPLTYQGEVLGILVLEGMTTELPRDEAVDTLKRLAHEAAMVMWASQISQDLDSGELEIAQLLEMR